MRSSSSGPNAQKKIMFPAICEILACMNMDVRIVIKCRPAAIFTGTSDHLVTNASPPRTSSKKTTTLTAMMHHVTTGVRVGRREASLSGISPMVSPRCQDLAEYFNMPQNSPHGASISGEQTPADQLSRVLRVAAPRLSQYHPGRAGGPSHRATRGDGRPCGDERARLPVLQSGRAAGGLPARRDGAGSPPRGGRCLRHCLA